MAELNLMVYPPGSDGVPWKALIGIVPHVLWALVLVGLFLWIGPGATRSALGRMSKLGFAGLELEFREGLEAAAEAHETPASSDELDRASRRLASAAALVRGARILWVDDEPDNNSLDVRLLRSAGAKVKLALSTEQALRELARAHFELVISDIARGDEADAGVRMAEELRQRGVTSPVIFYAGTVRKPIPDEAFGLTNRPDELLHLVLDALARLRS